MKRIVFSLSFLAISFAGLSAQDNVRIHLRNGETISMLSSNIDSITFFDPVVDPIEPGSFLKSSRYSVFGKLVKMTGLYQSGRVETREKDVDYLRPKPSSSSDTVPSQRKLYHTVFVEPDEVYTRAIPALASARTEKDTLELVKAYVLEWFEKEYGDGWDPEAYEAGKNEDWSSPFNYLNRFVAYHFLNRKVDRSDFSRYTIGCDVTFARRKEYYETLAPGQALYLSSGRNGHAWQNGIDPNPDRIVLNPNGDLSDYIFDEEMGWGRPTKDGTVYANVSLCEGNAIIHEVDGVLFYPRNEFKKMRFRYDLSALSTEIMDNELRYLYISGGQISLPCNFVSNPQISENAVYKMHCPNITAGGVNTLANAYQGDVMEVSGSYDLVFRLPPVPMGSYEVRLGGLGVENIVGQDSKVEFYLGVLTDEDWKQSNWGNLKPIGEIDMLQTPIKCGWISDEKDSTSLEKIDSDKIMREGGWMKAPNSINSACGNLETSLRDLPGKMSSDADLAPMRRVLGTIVVMNDASICVRVRNATGSTAPLYMDYLEVCPDCIYANPFIIESKD